MNITIENTELDPNTGGRNETTEARDFYFTGREIYVHDVVDGETSPLDKSMDSILLHIVKQIHFFIHMDIILKQIPLKLKQTAM